MIDINFQKTITLKNGQEVVLRYPKPGDIDALLSFVNEIAEEDTFVSVNEPKTYEEELDWAVGTIKRIRARKEVVLIAEFNGEIVGSSGVHPSEPRSDHVGIFGIMISKVYRGQGLGRQLMNTALELAKEVMSIKLVKLDMYAPNNIACTLYQSLGFQEYGRLPKGVFYKGQYVDRILMYKNLEDF